MNFFTNMKSATAMWCRTPASRRDLALTCFVVLLVWSICVTVEMQELFTAWTRDHEALQLDELPFVFFASAVMLVWYSRRRLKELEIEIERRNAAERAHQYSQRTLKTLFEESLCGNFVADTEGHIIFCNEAFRSMSGRGNEALDLKMALGGIWQELPLRLQAAGKLDFMELSVKRADNSPWVVNARFTYTIDEDNDGAGRIYGFFADVTEEHLAEKELASMLSENQALIRHAMQAQEAERRYIAREMHDEIGQYLTAIRLDAAALPKEGNSTITEHARRIAQHANHIQVAIKNLIYKLRPIALDAHGLLEAVRQLAREWSQQYPSIKCHLDLDRGCSSLPDEISIVVYRLVQEALTNIVRHAQAHHVDIRIWQDRKKLPVALMVEIRDDGIGFNTQLHSSGFGLTAMRERIEAVNGTLGLLSGEGAGVLISVRIPLPSRSTHSASRQEDSRLHELQHTACG